MLTPEEVFEFRSCYCDFLMTLDGLSYASNADKYSKIIHPNDPLPSAKQMAASQSSCGLTVEAALRHTDIPVKLSSWGKTKLDPEQNILDMSYGDRLNKVHPSLYALTIEQEWAKRNGFWVDAVKFEADLEELYPLQGDIVFIRAPELKGTWFVGHGFNYEHVLSVVAWDGVCVCIEGGQPGIEKKDREFMKVGTELWTCKAGTPRREDGRPQKGDRVKGWISFEKMVQTIMTQ